MTGAQRTWAPQPRQHAYMTSTADEVFFGGSAGGGKSDAALMLCVARRIKYPGTAGLIVRRSLSELEGGSGLIPRSKSYLTGIAEYGERKKRWTFPNGSTIDFGYCDRDDDVRHYDGSEYADISFEELQHFSEFQFTYLRSRCRVKVEPGKKPVPALIRATGMPQPPGLAWVKRTFIDPAPNGGEWEVDLPEGMGKIRRAFIPARLDDNKYLTQNDDYRRKLMALPERMRRALLEGRWDLFEGRFFDGFDRGRHVIVREIRPEWARLISIDYGYAAPFCGLWAAADEAGRLHVYRELYQSGMRDEEQAVEVLRRSQGERIATVKADPSCWNRRGETGRSVSEVWAAHGLVAVKAGNERRPGWGRVRSMLAEEIGGLPTLTIDPSCVNTIRQLEDAASDDRDPEEIDDRVEDHALDAIRYLVADYRGGFQPRMPNAGTGLLDVGRYLAVKNREGRSLFDAVRERMVPR